MEDVDEWQRQRRGFRHISNEDDEVVDVHVTYQSWNSNFRSYLAMMRI